MEELRKTYELIQKHCPLFLEDDLNWKRKMNRVIWLKMHPELAPFATIPLEN